jgi:hypothetical protein
MKFTVAKEKLFEFWVYKPEIKKFYSAVTYNPFNKLYEVDIDIPDNTFIIAEENIFQVKNNKLLRIGNKRSIDSIEKLKYYLERGEI